MTPLFKKLNFKNQTKIVCINAPNSFKVALNEMEKFATINLNITKQKDVNFIIVFVTTQKELDNNIKTISKIVTTDAVVWFCYPKQSSKNYVSQINRDNGWQILGNYDYEPVRGVAIDDDWSALRFKKIDTIKIFNRKSGALSNKGKERIQQDHNKK